MPIGVIVNSLSVALGGIFGALLANKLSDKLKDSLTMIFGACSMGMGIASIAPMENMPAVVFSIVIGTAVGVLLNLGGLIDKAGIAMQKPFAKIFPKQTSTLSKAEYNNMLVTIIVLFCASGTGIYGSLVSGITGDHTILITKSILDFFTAAIFATTLGYVVSSIAIPQLIIFLILFILAKFIMPLTTPTMITDFQAAGGFLMLVTGFRMIKLKNFPVADMLPAMILVMPFSWAWVNWILPLF